MIEFTKIDKSLLRMIASGLGWRALFDMFLITFDAAVKVEQERDVAKDQAAKAKALWSDAERVIESLRGQVAGLKDSGDNQVKVIREVQMENRILRTDNTSLRLQRDTAEQRAQRGPVFPMMPPGFYHCITTEQKAKMDDDAEMVQTLQRVNREQGSIITEKQAVIDNLQHKLYDVRQAAR